MTDEEAIERMYDLIHTCEVGIEQHGTYDDLFQKDKQAIETVLKLIQKQQKEINALNQVHRYDEKTIDEVKGEAVKLYKIIDEMAKYIEEQTGSCPLDMFDYKEIDCENVCKQEMYPCWIEYFKRKVEDK